MKDLKDKVAVVTGGASGIGLGIGRALATEGCHVVVADVNLAAAEKAARELADTGVRTISVACDVTKQADIDKLCEQAWASFGHVDLLFNNAGVMPELQSLADTDEKNLRWVFEVNLFGAWNVCQAFTRRFIAQGTPAHIVNTGSENSIASPVPMTASYNATKHAVLGFSGILRMELPEFIQVSVLCPGAVSTNIATSTEQRPDEFGGPVSSPLGGEEMPGMDPDEIGRHTVERVKHGDFFIITHACVRYMVEERYTELLAAFDKQAPWYEGCESLDTRRMFEEAIKAQLKEQP